MALERDANISGPIGALIDRGEERGCVDLKEVDELAQALDLEDEDLGALYEQLHARHIEFNETLRGTPEYTYAAAINTNDVEMSVAGKRGQEGLELKAISDDGRF